MLPSPAELTYFFEIASCLNFSRASERLGVSQPSLSFAIKRLENTLGINLFIRHKQGVTLTPAGEQLLAQVKPLLHHWENTKIQAISLHNEVRGKVTIGCRSATSLLLGGFLRNLLEKHPRLEIDFKFQSPQKTTEAVIDSSVDIGIVINPLQHYDLVIHKIDDMETSLWVGHGNQNIQNIDSGEAVIICEPNVPHSQILLRQLEKLNFRIGRILKVNSLEAIANFTIEGCGIGILPACFATNMYSDKLKKIEGMPVCTDDICLIYRHENKNVQAISTVIAALKRAASDLPDD